jgi:hypothetical protein
MKTGDPDLSGTALQSDVQVRRFVCGILRFEKLSVSELLTVESVTKRFGNRIALDDVGF